MLNKIEQTVFNILKGLKLEVHPQYNIDKYTVDFLVEGKYIIECYGDFWHCNPQRYGPSYFNKGKRKTAEEIWQRDSERKKTFEELGYMFMSLWESDIKNNSPRTLKKKIKTFIQKERKNGHDDDT